MKKLLLTTLACALMMAIVPFAAATSPSAEATPTEAVSPVVAPTEASPQEDVLAEDLATLEVLFSEPASASCIDSGIPCFSDDDCGSTCGSLECECRGTCVFCG